MKTRFMETLVADMETDRALEMTVGAKDEDFRTTSPVFARGLKARGLPAPEKPKGLAATARAAQPLDPVPSANTEPLPADGPSRPRISSDPNAPPLPGNLSIQMPDSTINIPLKTAGRPRVTFGPRFARTPFQADGKQIDGESVSAWLERQGLQRYCAKCFARRV